MKTHPQRNKPGWKRYADMRTTNQSNNEMHFNVFQRHLQQTSTSQELPESLKNMGQHLLLCTLSYENS